MMRSHLARRLALPICAVLAAGCYSVSQQAKIEMRKPVDCATAERDLALLHEERASVLQKISAGVQAVEPAEAVFSLIGGTEGDKISVALGEYNDRIDAKIAEIRKECGVE
jgi:hypothetical protein